MKKREELVQEMETLFRFVFRQLRQEINEVYNSELSTNEFMVLRMLVDSGRQRSTDLSKYLQVSASHITAVTDLLLSKGYIARKRSENDRRIIDIELTEEGQGIFNAIQEKKRAYFLERFEHFTDKEIETVNKLFHKIKGDQK
ncbi:MarR family transcriptional regulator [Bacillus megaterium]|nr:MarR family transcriptional regulator [Priestia megaterium]